MLTQFISPSVVDAMIKHCKNDPTQWRVHPNAPDCEEANEYKVLVLDEETEDTKKETVSQVNGVMQLQDARTAQILSNMPAACGGPLDEPRPLTPSLPSNPHPMTIQPDPDVSVAEAAAAVTATMEADNPSGGGSVSCLSARDAKLADYAKKLQKKEEEKALAKAKALAKKEEAQRVKEKKMEEQREERERLKQLSSSKAVKWAEGLTKDIGIADDHARKAKEETQLSSALRDEYAVRWNKWKTDLENLKDTMSKVTCETEAAALLASGPQKVREFHHAVKTYGRLVKMNIF